MKESLRVKIFRINIILITVALLLFAVFGIYQVRRYADLMEQTSRSQNAVIVDSLSDSMRGMAMESFRKYVVSEAKIIDSEFWTMRHDLEILAKQVQMVLEEPSAYSPVEVPLPSQADAGQLSLQLLYSDRADKDDPALKEQILRIGGLRNMMLEMVGGGESLMDCMVSLPGGASIIVDRTPESKVGPDGEPQPYNAYRRPWYVGAIVHESTYFTPVNLDNYYETYEVMAGVPVYVDGKLAAVCGGSVMLSSFADIIANATLGDYSDTCLINENGNMIYSSRTEGELGIQGVELKSLLEGSNAELVALVDEALKGDVGFSLLEVDGEKTYVAYAPISTLGWTQLLCISQENLNATAYLLAEKTDAVMEESVTELRSNEGSTIITTMVIAVLMLVLAGILSLVFSKRLVDPIKKMTLRISEMKGDNMSFQVEDVLLTGDEIEVLARAFASMSEKMRGYVREIVSITSEKQRMATELSVAADIQLNMLPTTFPAFPERKEFELFAVMDPAKEVGGDFYDFFLIDEDHLALVIADVSGKGVPAALFMVISKTLIKNVALSGLYNSPAEILQEVNGRLCEGNKDDMFVTVWLGVLTISTGELISACAGHEYPVFFRREQGFVLEKDPHGLAMGVLESSRYRNVRWHMDPGDLLFLYTDGVPEANNSREELFGNERMLKALESSRQEAREQGDTEELDLQRFLRNMRAQIDSFAGETPQYDDLTMLCVEYKGCEPA
ncbi:MAG: SpoIIE family protein phosphatase [Oscillospiraceae bacterium]|nr:SpoIIE family protein phosphatase [Oscillospiraceae bacterium]MBR4657449.1 SpoIIE family protein phosphatase [Oscillospiraceae bacterium]